MVETQETARVLQSQLKSESEEKEEVDERIMKSNKEDDEMTLAQYTQTRRRSSLNPSLPLTKVVADNIYMSESCKKKVSFADLDEVKLSSTNSGKAEALSALERAKEIQLRSGQKYPCFIKSMLRSHVSGCFWLSLPSRFFRSQMPKSDADITLVDENGETCITKFIAKHGALSGGWRGFAVAHKLVEEDVLVFQLVKATEFKVCIVRAHDLAEVDVSFGLQQLKVCDRSSDPGTDIKTFQKREHPKSYPLTDLQNKKQKTSPPISDLNLSLTTGQQSENGSDEVDSEGSEGIRLSGCMVEFKDMKNLDDFKVTMNSLVIGHETSELVQTKYYELCCSQNTFLHEHLLDGFNCQLVAGIISETVNIADAIRSSKLSTSHNEFLIWDTILQAFEQLGMNVGFLRSRLKQIMNLAFESEQAVDSKRYREAISRRAHVQEEIKTLEENLVELRNESQRLETDIETLKVKAEKHELTVQAKINECW